MTEKEILNIIINEKTLTKDIINTLPHKEKTVIELKYHQRLSVKDISTQLQLTRSRIWQIEKSAIRKLRHTSRLEKIKAIDRKVKREDSWGSMKDFIHSDEYNDWFMGIE